MAFVLSQKLAISERLNRTLVEVARSMILHAGLSKAYWVEAVAIATYLHNQMVSAAIKSGMTPYQMWYHKKPNSKYLVVKFILIFQMESVKS